MILKVLDKRKETKDCFSLILEKPEGFRFYPGQYLNIKLPVGDPFGNTRAFTISSSPTEDFLMITTTKGETLFKKFMENLKPGDTVSASHPAGTFILDETEPAVFMAGGIGITPFRSMIKYALDQNLETPITFLYSNSDNQFLFKQQLDTWGCNLPKLKVIYHQTNQNSRLTKTQIEPIVQMYANSIFYLAGSPNMVGCFEKILLKLGVDSDNIRYDRFSGY